MLFCFPSQFIFGFSGIFYALLVPLRTLILIVSNIASTELSSSLSDAVVLDTCQHRLKEMHCQKVKIK